MSREVKKRKKGEEDKVDNGNEMAKDFDEVCMTKTWITNKQWKGW